MARLKQLVSASYKQRLKLNEADSEAPEEDDELSLDDDTGSDDSLSLDDEESVDGTEEDEEPTDEEEAPEDDTGLDTVVDVPEEDEDFDAVDKTIESMVGVTNIQHTTSSTILDFEDGGQLMFVQPMVSIKSPTLTKIISLINDDVKEAYEGQVDEITGKKLGNTKYWKSVDALISTMVRSQLTKSDNIDGMIDEIKQVFKVLEIK